MTSERTGPTPRLRTARGPLVALVALSLSAACMHGATARSSGETATAAAPAAEREATPQVTTPAETTAAVLVQGKDLASAAAAVRAVGGEITHELGIIDAVGARLTRRQIEQLEANEGLKVQADRMVGVTDTTGGPASDEIDHNEQHRD